MPPKPVSVETRLNRHIGQPTSSGCWPWTGAKRGNGYGAIWVGTAKTGGHRPAHRVMWELKHGPVPEGLFVLHTCDTRECVNPDHLFVGTHADNMRDMSEKGRAASHANGRFTSPRHWRVGETNHNAKLTRASALAIRDEYSAGGTSLSVLAMKFNVSKRTILNIVHNRIWR